MKFIILKLLEKYNLFHSYKVEGINTFSKSKELAILWNYINQ